MMGTYIEEKIKEALALSQGSEAKARQKIIAWAQEDQALLLALAKPHLSGIVAYNIERVTSGRAAKAGMEFVSSPVPAKKSQEPPKERFGLELLKAVAASDAAVFGLETAS